jgi:hypothetical protein
VPRAESGFNITRRLPTGGDACCLPLLAHGYVYILSFCGPRDEQLTGASLMLHPPVNTFGGSQLKLILFIMAHFNMEDVLSVAAKMEAITSKPEIIHELQDDSLRLRLREAGRKLSHAMEIPVDTARRLQSTVSTRAASTFHFTLYTV